MNLGFMNGMNSIIGKINPSKENKFFSLTPDKISSFALARAVQSLNLSDTDAVNCYNDLNKQLFKTLHSRNEIALKNDLIEFKLSVCINNKEHILSVSQEKRDNKICVSCSFDTQKVSLPEPQTLFEIRGKLINLISKETQTQLIEDKTKEGFFSLPVDKMVSVEFAQAVKSFQQAKGLTDEQAMVCHNELSRQILDYFTSYYQFSKSQFSTLTCTIPFNFNGNTFFLSVTPTSLTYSFSSISPSYMEQTNLQALWNKLEEIVPKKADISPEQRIESSKETPRPVSNTAASVEILSAPTDVPTTKTSAKIHSEAPNEVNPTPSSSTENIQINVVPPPPEVQLDGFLLSEYRTELLNSLLTRAPKMLDKGSDTVTLLNAISEEDFAAMVRSTRFYSTLSPEETLKIGLNRDFAHAPPDINPDTDRNEKYLKTKGSAVRLGGSGTEYIKENRQVCMLQKTRMMDNDNPVDVHVFSVPAPAFDDKVVIPTNKEQVGKKSTCRSETETYIDTSTFPATFKGDKYKIAHETIAAHIKKAANDCGAKRVVLSAYGMGAFLKGLELIDESGGTKNVDRAQDIAAEAFANMIQSLRAEGKEVCFSDVTSYIHDKASYEYGSEIFWNKVNEHLSKLKEGTLLAVNGDHSALGEGWVKSTDMIVNAWDPDSVAGNGLEADRSFDGQIGRRTLIYLMHAWLIHQFHSQKETISTK